MSIFRRVASSGTSLLICFCFPCVLLYCIALFCVVLWEFFWDKWENLILRVHQFKRNTRWWWRSRVPRAYWADPRALDPKPFCRVCQRNGVFRRLEGEDGYAVAGWWIYIKSPDDLSRRPYCPFCKLVLGLLPSTAAETSSSWNSMQEHPIQLAAFPTPLLGYKVYVDGHRVGDIVREKSNIDRVSVLNTQWILNLLDKCRHGHKVCNGSVGLTTRLTTSIKILLIDVQENCLAEASSNYEYLALSYVRGGVTIPETKQHDLESLKKPQSLKTLLPQTPAVVQDAIELVRRLGKRYLWVDAFCIVQDSLDKHRHIAQMDVIYSQALLSIVATSATDASCELPGLRPRGRPGGTAPIDTYSSLVTNRRLSDILAASLYETRGWTLQERVLSTRCLHLSDWDAVFQCQEFIQTEHNILPNKAYDPDSWHGPTMPFLSPLVTHDGVNPTPRASFDTYSHLVEIYTGRRLSYPSDALNAFSGILSAVEHHSDDQSRAGIPSKLLNVALLWVSTHQGTKDTYQSQSPSRNSDFPSWSWVGWKERASFFLSRFILDGIEPPLRSTPRWQMFDESSNSFRQLPQQEIPTPNTVSSLKDITGPLHIRGWVINAMQFVSQQTSSSESIGNRAFESYIHPTINSNLYCGKLYGSPIPSCNDQDKPMYELIQLFRFVPPPRPPETTVEQDVFGAVVKVVKNTPLLDYTGNEVDAFGEWKIPLIFVMLIEWKGAYAERLAVGYLYEDAWDAANQALKDITLT